MKKRWKVFWIVCAVFAATGILLTAAGVMLGGASILNGSQYGWSEDSWIGRIIGRARADYSSEGTADVGEIPEHGLFSDDAYVPGKPDGDKITEYKDVLDLSLDVAGLGVCLVPYNGDAILVDSTDLRPDIREALVANHTGDDLDIDMKWQDWDINDTGILYISIPGSIQLDQVSAQVGAGYLEIKGVAAEELSLEVGAGQIVAEDIYASNVEADCGAGQIIFSGEVSDGADIACGVGEVLFTLTGSEEDFDYELSCSIGEIALADHVYSGLANEFSIDNESGCLILAECDMGRIEIDFAFE